MDYYSGYPEVKQLTRTRSPDVIWMKNVSPNIWCWFGIYLASNSKAGKSANQERFKHGYMCVLIETSAFVLGVDVSDITYVILYGCPVDGLMYSQLSGRGV